MEPIDLGGILRYSAALASHKPAIICGEQGLLSRARPVDRCFSTLAVEQGVRTGLRANEE